MRLLKQIKERNTEKVYNNQNVLLYEITKNNAFLAFNFIDYAKESEHLKNYNEDELEAQILRAYKQSSYNSYEDIAQSLNTYKMKVSRIINKHKKKARATQHQYINAIKYYKKY